MIFFLISFTALRKCELREKLGTKTPTTVLLNNSLADLGKPDLNIFCISRKHLEDKTLMPQITN